LHKWHGSDCTFGRKPAAVSADILTVRDGLLNVRQEARAICKIANTNDCGGSVFAGWERKEPPFGMSIPAYGW
jgi:hypothetical protein